MPRQWHIYFEDPDIPGPAEVYTFDNPVPLRAAIRGLQRLHEQYVTVECSLGDKCPHVSGPKAEENSHAQGNATR